MLLPIIAVLVIGLLVAAVVSASAARTAETAVRLAGIERRRDHWRRTGEAAYAIQVAADAYVAAMSACLERNGGDGPAARRADEVGQAARAYADASRRLLRVLAAGPRPPRSHRMLALLTDPRHPEAVAAARPGDVVLAEVTDLQDFLDSESAAEERGRPLWRLWASAHLWMLASRWWPRRA